MEIMLILSAIALAIGKYVAKNRAAPEAKQLAEKNRQAAPKAAGKKSAPIGAVSQEKRAGMAQAEKWRAAKEQQDDAEQLHAIHIDSCESKLESLRVLYEAGILDSEEYAQRVARTKAKHAHGADR